MNNLDQRADLGCGERRVFPSVEAAMGEAVMRASAETPILTAVVHELWDPSSQRTLYEARVWRHGLVIDMISCDERSEVFQLVGQRYPGIDARLAS